MPNIQSIPYTPIGSQCVLTPDTCLYQVAGYVGNDPVAQLLGCQSQFGFPEVTTVTLPGQTVLTTTTATATYTDIFISTSTTYSTLEETSTSYETSSETATEYSTTLVSTLTTTVPASTTSSVVKKRDVKKRRTCQPQTTASSSSPPFPLATDCPDLAAYSSACACLEPTPVTVYAPAVTSVISETESITVTSTSEAVLTEPVTNVIVDPETTTLTSTLTTQTETTTTATQTTSPTPSVPETFKLVVSDGASAGKSAGIAGAAPAYSLTSVNIVSSLTLTGPGTPLLLASNTAYTMYVRMSTATYGVVFLTTSAYVASSPYTFAAVTCSLDPSTLIISCSTPGGLDRILLCGSTYYMANPTTTPGGCTEVHLRAVAS